MVATTSIEAYRQIKEEGLLNLRSTQVLEVVVEIGPCVGSEIARVVKERYGSWCESETIRNRLTEMRDLGVVKVIGKERSSNNRLVYVWEATGGLPIKGPKKKNKDQIIAMLEAENAELRKKLGLPKRGEAPKQNPLRPMTQPGLFDEPQT